MVNPFIAKLNITTQESSNEHAKIACGKMVYENQRERARTSLEHSSETSSWFFSQVQILLLRRRAMWIHLDNNQDLWIEE